MTKWTFNKHFWQWLSIICYIGILTYMGQKYLHRIIPDVFFGALIILTALLMITLKFIESRNHKA